MSFKISKIGTFLIGITMVAILLSWSGLVQAAQEGDYFYTVVNGKAQITKYTGSGGVVVIPSDLEGFPVISVENDAFLGRSDVTAISISQGVTSIGAYAFKSCAGITEITIPQGVTTIGDGAFMGCTGLTEIIISQRVTSIGDWAFNGCTGLRKITVDAGNLKYRSEDGVLFDKSGSTLIVSPAGIKAVTIPQGVTRISDNAFSGCTGLTSIIIPQGVTSIGAEAFSGCTGLTSIIIPQGVTTIKDGTFYGCTGLTSFTIPQGVTSIGSSAFSGCTGLTSIIIPQGVTSVGDATFYGCTGLLTITIPEGLKSVGNGVFYGCIGLKSFTIPKGITSIGNEAFSGCAELMEITVDVGNSKYRSMDGVLFDETGSTLIVSPPGIKDVTIPQGVTSISDNAFSGSRDLKSITFNSATTFIHDAPVTIPVATKIIGYDPSEAKDYAAKYNRTFEVKSTPLKRLFNKSIAFLGVSVLVVAVALLVWRRTGHSHP